MKSSIRNEIKAQIVRAGYTMQEVVDLLHDEYGWSDSVLVIAIIVIVLVVKLVSGVAGGNSIVGQWRSETNESLVFNKDGSCDAPFTYNAAWLEAADHYTVSDDGTLSMFGSRGSFTLTFEKVETEEEALESYEDLTYYISGDTLIIAQETYTRVG